MKNLSQTARLREDIEREREYLKQQEVGTDEYVASRERLNALESAYAEAKKAETEFVLDCVKFGVGTATSVGVTLLVMKFEETGILRSALKGVVNCFVPKKMY